ncbi:MAG: hypothetical protein AVDCRST_MAG96-2718 [uncultured Segetibacter sp.]|uniref:Uncharacterized protein n=1 Tax=uncultured Segetibacter sp. TaxID=481133 RepID=A0A6J4T936_9BACT|nr:MAG: hypothetical protein AVDCRST_MAG96-2718 [uncultured Segetibacter sp.]
MPVKWSSLFGQQGVFIAFLFHYITLVTSAVANADDNHFVLIRCFF